MYSLRKHFLTNYAKAAFGSNSSGLEGLLSSYTFGNGNTSEGTLGVRCPSSVENRFAARRYHSGKDQRLVTKSKGHSFQELSSKLRLGPFLSHRESRYYSQSTSEAVDKQAASATTVDGEEGIDKRNLGEESELDDEDNPDMDEIDGEGSLFLTEEELQELSQGDPELIKRIKFCQLEYAVYREEGGQVPSKLFNRRRWLELLELNSKSKRRKFYLYLFKIEMKDLSEKRKKEERRKQKMEEWADDPIPTKEEDIYGVTYLLARNTLFLRLYDTTVNRFFNGNACSAIMHHPSLILDCSYDEFMSPRESKNCAKQLELVIAENRVHKEPFSLHLCNAGRHTKTMDHLRRMVPVLDDDHFVVNVHEECFTELFPKKRLVYLTPHTRDDLEEYDEDDIYIVGAMVDKSSPRPYSFAKAKKLGIAMRRLPLDKHLMWGEGGKSLTLNQVVRIMLDVRYARGDWKEGLKCVPMRKLCREFHPYPDQVDAPRESNDSSGVSQYRREKMSNVFKDHELINRRKGFRRSEMFTPNNNRPNNRIVTPNVKSILYDYD